MRQEEEGTTFTDEGELFAALLPADLDTALPADGAALLLRATPDALPQRTILHLEHSLQLDGTGQVVEEGTSCVQLTAVENGVIVEPQPGCEKQLFIDGQSMSQHHTWYDGQLLQIGENCLLQLMTRRIFDPTFTARLQDLLLRDARSGARLHECFALRLEHDFTRARALHQPLGLLCIQLRTQQKPLAVTLRELSMLIRWHVRARDLLASAGDGQSLLVLCPNADHHGCRLVAERIQAAINEAELGPEMKISIGYASWPVDAEDALVEAANKAVTLAKERQLDHLASQSHH